MTVTVQSLLRRSHSPCSTFASGACTLGRGWLWRKGKRMTRRALRGCPSLWGERTRRRCFFSRVPPQLWWRRHTRWWRALWHCRSSHWPLCSADSPRATLQPQPCSGRSLRSRRRRAERSHPCGCPAQHQHRQRPRLLSKRIHRRRCGTKPRCARRTRRMRAQSRRSEEQRFRPRRSKRRSRLSSRRQRRAFPRRWSTPP
mmetsp:Transcript_23482/g.76409  ORF Transcript_23482/g.76409 Transcript_23482/m.76409 type:complete len:200 (-) Transcript_23482:1535-2134(-)